MIRTIIIVILSCFILPGCAMPPVGSDPSMDKIKQTVVQQKEDLNSLKNAQVVEVSQGIYLGPPTPVDLPETVILPPIFKERITYFSGGELYLNEVAERLTSLTGIYVSVAPNPKDDEEKKTVSNDPKESSLTPLDRARSTPMRINFSGTFEKLLDVVASHFAMNWKYVNKAGAVQFFMVDTKTYALVSPTGTWSMTSVVSNSSTAGDSSNSSSSATAVNTSSDTTTTGEQTVQTNAQMDVWSQTVAAIQSMLSGDGEVVANSSAGAITVTDHSAVHYKVQPESVNKCCQRCWLEISTIFFENPGDFRPENFQLKDHCRFASSENRLFAVFRRTTPRNAA